MAIVSIPISRNSFSLPISSPKRHRFPVLELHSPIRISCSATRDGSELMERSSHFKELKSLACGMLAVWAVNAASPVIAANQQFQGRNPSPGMEPSQKTVRLNKSHIVKS